MLNSQKEIEEQKKLNEMIQLKFSCYELASKGVTRDDFGKRFPLTISEIIEGGEKIYEAITQE